MKEDHVAEVGSPRALDVLPCALGSEAAVVARHLRADPGVAECAVLVRESSSGARDLVAYVVAAGPFAPETLAARLAISLPAGLRPAAWVPVSALPRTAAGEVDAAALGELAVLDGQVIQGWEAELLARPDVAEAAVVVVEAPLEPPRRLHLADLLPGWQERRPGEPVDAAGAASTAEAPAELAPPSLVEGGEPPLAGVAMRLSALLQRAAESAPDHGILYLRDDGGERFQPYPELLREAGSLLTGLRGLGLEPGDPVLFQLPRREDFLPALWACFLGGFVPLPAAVAASYEAAGGAAGRLHNAWLLLDRPLVLTDREHAAPIVALAERLELAGFVLAEIENLRAAEAEIDPERWHAAAPDDLALLLMTSGSTGKPKLVTHTHRSLVTREASAAREVGWTGDDVSLNWLPLDHVATLVDFHLRVVFLGAREVQVPTEKVLEDPLRWLDWIDRYRATVTWAPNFAYALLAEREVEIRARQWDLSCLRCAINGGEAIVARSARRAVELLSLHGLPAGAMRPTWGMSETASGAAYGRLTLTECTGDEPFVEVGRPIPGIAFRVVDEEQRLVPEGTIGRLQVRGPVVTAGYHRRPELNREVFTHDGWFRTGDYAMLRGGKLTLTGREADFLVIRGLNYYSHEIESVVDEIPGVQVSWTAACGVRAAAGEGDRLAIFFHTPLGEPRARAALLREIRDRVLRETGLHPDLVVPLEREEIPKTAIGKIQRSRLKQLFEAGELAPAVRAADLLAGNENTLPSWFFRRVFRPLASAPEDLGPMPGRVALLLDRAGLGEVLAAELRVRGCVVEEVAVDRADPGAWRRRLEALGAAGALGGIVSLLDTGEAAEAVGEEQSAADVLDLLRVVVSLGEEGAPVPLWLAADRSQAAVPGDLPVPARALVPALVQTARREIAGLRCRHLDLPVAPAQENVRRVLAELAAGDGEPEVAWRGGLRLVPRLELFDPAGRAPGALPFRRGGVYLITGGLGGIGTVVARHLLAEHQARLLLVGRGDGGDPARRQALDELRELGGEVAYVALDLAGEGGEEAFVVGARRALARWEGRLDGVFHLAAALREAPLGDETAAGLAAVLRPKAAGCRALERLIAGSDAFFLAFSSVNSFFGGADVGSYAAANRYLEAFCRGLRERHAGRVACFAWSMWDEVGMSRGYAMKDLVRAGGYATLTPRQGLDALLAGLAADEPELLVGLDAANPRIARLVVDLPPRPMQRLIGFYTAADGGAGGTGWPEVADRYGRPTSCELRHLDALPRLAGGVVDRCGLVALGRSAGAAEPETATERLVAALFSELLGVGRVSLTDNFFQLGGHSILATRLLARLRDAVGVDVPAVALLAGPTVGQLAAEVDRRRPEASVAAGDTPPPLRIVPAPQDRFEPFPLTEIQQAYWIGGAADFELGDVSMHFYQEIDGKDLDLARLEAAWWRLIERHDMLRTVILPEGRQRILEQVPPCPIAVDDLRGLVAEEVEARLAETRRWMSHQTFELDRWPWFELRASVLDGGRTRIHLSTSVIHLDGGSLFLLMTEWGALYRDPQAALPRLELTFRDYALALADVRETAEHARAWSYWQERVATLPPAPPLPLVQHPSTLQGYRFTHRVQTVEAATWRRIEKLAAKMGLSRSAIVLTAYAAVLATWSGSRRLTINVTLFNRLPLHPQINDVLGDFTSMVLLAVERDPGDTFETLARQVQTRLWSDLEHRQVSGVRVARELARVLGEHRAALTPVVFTSAIDLEMRGATSPSSAMRGIGDNVYHVSQTPQVLLDFQLFEDAGDLICIWDAVDEAFPPGLLDDMFASFGRQLRALAQEESWKAAPQLVPEHQLDERAAVNATAAPLPDLLLHEPFLAQARSRPEDPAVVSGGLVLTYGELLERSVQVAAWLVRHGARRNALVAVVMEKGWQQVVGVLGVLTAGAAYLPIDPGLPRERRAYLLANGGVGLALTQEALDGDLEWPAGVERLAVDGPSPGLAPPPGEPAVPAAEPEDLAYVIFTSGSTGMPKGVMISHRGAVNTILDVNRRFGIGPGDRVLALSALNFDLSVWDVFGVLAAGGTLVFPDPGRTHDPGHWLDLLERYDVSLWNTVPALMEMLVDLATGRGVPLPARLRLALLSGDWIPVALPDRLRELAPGLEVISLGGATEASIWSILHPIGRVDPAWRSIPYGRPMDNQRFHVLDEALQPVPVWVPGYLYIGGTGLALGYWGDLEKTAASFLVHPQTGERLYRTGDRGRWLPGGDIEFLGRDDAQVKVHGLRIELGEIEAALLAHPAVAAAVVQAVGEGHRDRRLVAWVVPAAAQPGLGEELRRFLAGKLPPYMVPAAVVEIAALPLSATGKIDRKALLAPADLPARGAAGYVAPRNALEQELAQMWQELLKIDRLGVHDDLLQLGGNSLLAILAISRLRERHRVEVPLRVMLSEDATVAKLAEAVARLAAGGEVPAPGLPQAVPAPAGRHEPFPLHAIQEAYWIGRRDAFELGNVAAYFFLEVEVPDLEPERLGRAWQQVIDRHDMLRAVIEEDGRQRILEHTPPYRIDVLDLRGRPAAQVEAALDALRGRMSQQVMAADRWPLFELRATLLDGAARLHFGLDLLIADAWSVQILFRDLERFYHAPGEPLPALALSYRDYLLAERTIEGSALWERSREFWWRRLDELEPAPRLPLVKDLAEIVTPRFVRRRAVLPAAAWRRLKERAGRLRVTPSGLLLTAFSEVLATWSRSPRFTLNVTTFNRLPLHPQVEEVVGDFTSLTLLAVDAACAATFEERAQRLQAQLLEDLEHRYVTGIRVLRELARRRGRAPGALAPIVFTSLLSRYEGSDTASFLPLGGEPVFATSQTPQVWLDHQVLELRGELAFTWDVVEELLPPGLLDDLFDAYVALLHGLAAGEAAWRAPRLALLPAQQLLQREQVNATAAPLPAAVLHGLFAGRAVERGGAPAVRIADRTLTYAELAERSGRIAAWLGRRGAQTNRLVAVVMSKGWEQVVAVLGILRSGAAYLPIDPELPAHRRTWLLAHGEVELVLTQSHLADALEWPEGLRLLRVDAAEEGDEAAAAGAAGSAGPEDLAYVIFTSGSTGTPKGVMIEHRGAVNTLLDVNRRFAVGPEDRVLAVSALSFDLSVYDVFGLLAAGGSLTLPRPEAARDPEHWLDLMHRDRVTIWNSAPALLEMLVEHAATRGERLPASLRLVLLSGDWIPVSLPGRLRTLAPGAAVVSLGGATEASIWSILYPIAAVDPAWRSIPYGRPMDNQGFHVLNRALAPCPVWVPGDLYISGTGLARGYWRDPAKTAASFFLHPGTGERLYRTGDLGRYLPGGDIEFLGRDDLQVKIQGFRIELGEIEAVLAGHGGVAAVVVAVVGEARTARRLAAFFVPATEAPAGAGELRALAEERLPAYMVPVSFTAIDALPLTANGKVDRAALAARAPAFAAGEGESAGRAPETLLEERLAALWSELLGLETVGAEDALFDLGGSSLLAIQMLSRVKQGFGVEVSLRRLLAAPTIAGLAVEIERLAAEEGDAAAGAEPPPVVPAPQDLGEPFPLNEIQQAYWLGRTGELELGNVAPHFYFELELATREPERIERAWQRLVARHGMLRAIFLPDGRQQILGEVPRLEIPILDLVGRPAAEAEAVLQEVRARLSHQMLPVDRWPLFEIVVSRLAAERVRVHFSFDLLIADAWSARLLFLEFARLYRDPELALPPLDLTFRDYVMALQRLPDTALYRRSREYWMRRLPALPPAPELPLVKDPAAVGTPQFVRRAGRLAPAPWQRLQELARERGLTPSGLLLAVYAEVLAAWSQGPRFTLNVTTFNRLPVHPQIDAVIGDFTSLTLLAVDAADGATFEERARRVQQQLWEDLDHRHMNGVEVLRELARLQGRSPGALMPVVFTSRLFDGTGTEDSFLGLTGGEVVYSVSQTPQVWIDKQVADEDGALVWTWDTVEELFPEGLLDEAFAAFGRALAALSQGEESWRQATFDLVPEHQAARADAVNATAAPVAETTLPALFAAQAAERPAHPAVLAAGRRLTYSELAVLARRVAGWLEAREVRPDTLVAIVMDKGWEQVVAALGVTWAGAAYLPIDPEWPAGRRAELLASGGAVLALTQPCWDEELEWPADVERLAVSDAVLAGLEPAAATPTARPGDLAYVIFTSGSTGRPKGVAIEHRSAVNTLLDVNARFGVGPGDRVFALSALTFDLSVYDLFGVLAAGGTLVLPEPWARRDPSRWAELMHEHQVTVWNSVPALLELLLEHAGSHPGAVAPSLALVLLSGDWLPLDVADRLRAHVPEAAVISLGGATEASIWSILHPVGAADPAWPSVPYGKPMASQSFHVLDARLCRRPDWVPGELYIGGAGLARGYWDDEEKTAASFLTHPQSGERLYRTGDLGRYRPDGNIEFLGRRDGQVKIQGYRIELGEIEAALVRHPLVAAAVVVAPPLVAGGRGRRLVGWVVPQGAEAVDGAELGRFLAGCLPAYMVPTLFVAIDALPLTANGKVDRGALERSGLPREDAAAVESGAPRTPIEARLVELWTELLGVATVGIRDNLFQLGGSSLLAIRLISRIRELFAVEVSLRELFGEPTVAHLAACIAREKAAGTAAPAAALPLLAADPAARHQPFPLNEVQQAYWVGRLQGFELGNVAAHSYTEIENVGFDLAAFGRALNRMIERHDALRTVFLPDGRQQILREVPPYVIEVLDLCGRPAAEAEGELSALRAWMSHQVLPADRWPLFEIRASRLDAGRIRLHLSFDLLISDAWSSQILFRELAEVMEQPDLTLPQLEISFRDYVLAEQALQATEVYRGSREYWLARLDELPPAPELPQVADLAAVAAGRAPRFVRRSARLSLDEWKILQERSAALGVTPSGLLLTAFSEVLACWSASPRFTLNLTTFNRLPLHPQVNRLMGDFTSLTLLAVDAAGGEAFAIKARRLQEQLWSDLDHRHFNGVAVMRELARRKGRPDAALVPVVFTSRLFRDGLFGEEVADLRYGEVVYSVSQTPQVWLDHQVVDEADGLAWTWDTVDELFPAGLIDDVFAAYTGLLHTLAADTAAWERPVLRGAFLPAGQRALQAAVNATAEELGGGLLHELFARRAAEQPEALAVVAPERNLSYRELAESAHRVAGWLRERGARPGHLVAVVMEKGWEQVVGVLGVLAAGAAYLPVDPGLPAGRLHHLLAEGEVELALTQSWLDGGLDWPAAREIVRLPVDRAAFDPALPAVPPAVEQDASDLAYVIFTSGSTGKPKGVAIDHRGAVNTLLDINRRFAVGAADRVLALSALNFDLSVYDLFGALAAGAAVVLPRAGSERDPRHWIETIERSGVTVWSSVPALLEMLVEASEAGGEAASPASLRLVLLSGDWVPVTLPDRLRRQVPAAQVVSLGGATEASIWSILHPIGEVDPAWPSIPYGKPMVNQRFYVLDEAMAPRPVWVAGDLYIGGIGLARGYWRDPVKTAESFVEHPGSGERLYRTGDRGRWLPDGSIEFLGREDLQVKIQGYRIELGEIEAACMQHPAVAAVVVTAPPVAGGDRRSRRLVAHVVRARRDGADGPASAAALCFQPVSDPIERLQFKLERRGLRRDLEGRPEIPFPGRALGDADIERWAARRSHRRFRQEPIPLADFGRFLSVLRQIQPPDLPLPKARYPSAGGLYPVQAYVALGDGAVAGLAAGIYAYQPRTHQLLRRSGLTLDRRVHGPDNRSVFDQAGFTLFLIGRMSAIGPLYPQTARDFCLLEAGYMGQLLMSEAPAVGLGLCPLGGLDFAAIRDGFGLEPTDLLVHSFLGGLAERAPSLLAALQEEQPPPPRPGALEAGAPSKLTVTAATAEERDWSRDAITEPVARLEFKLAGRGLPVPRPGEPRIELPAPPVDAELLRTYALRRSCRRYLDEEIPLADLASLLGCLRQIQPADLPLPKARYPSGGGLYPVHACIAVKPGRVAGLAAGTYAYDPVAHRLVFLQAGELDRRVHGAVNQPIFDRSALSLFLVARLGAVAPLYPGLARDFCALEAGYMGQLLMSEAPGCRLGLVPLGGVDVAAIRPLLDLEDDHELVHVFEVGRIPAEPVTLAEALADQPPPPAFSADRTASEGAAKAVVEMGLSAGELRDHLASRLPGYMVPPTIDFLAELPLTANGKVDRAALERRAAAPLAPEGGATPAGEARRVAPRTELESRLAALVRDLLGVAELGIDDNFFELGATSLQMIQIQRRIQSDLGREVEITAVFRNPNVTTLATALGGEEERQVEEGQERARRRKEAGRRRQRPGAGRGEDR